MFAWSILTSIFKEYRMKKKTKRLLVILGTVILLVAILVITNTVRTSIVSSNSLAAINTAAQKALQQPTAAAELTFSFTRQGGIATNQYAVWIEDSQGQYVKTLYATSWTANGGWRRRPTSIPSWVRQSGIVDKTQIEIDSISSATPATGAITHVWDGRNSQGTPDPNGDYVLFLEGTLRWGNIALYRAPVRLGQGNTTSEVSIEYSGDSTAERTMISEVILRTLR